MSEQSTKTVSVRPDKTVGAANVEASPAIATDSGNKSFYKFNTSTAEHATQEELSKLGRVSTGNGSGRSVLSFNVCCAEGNRKSIKLSKSLYESLFGAIDEDADPKELQVLKDGTNLIIGEDLPGVSESFAFSNPTSMMVYGTLTLWIVKAFKLDFTNGRTSRSYQRIEVVTPENGGKEKPYAIIDMTRPLKK